MHGVRKVVYGKTKTEARRKLAELRGRAALSDGLPDSGKRTVNDLLDQLLEVSAPK